MQDPQTGNMIEINEETAKVVEKLGVCVLSVGEKINVNNTDLQVHTFDKKEVMLEFLTNDVFRNFKIGDRVNIKNGTFKVQGYGAKFLTLRGVPDVNVLNQEVVDRYRRDQIKTIRKS